MQPLIRTILLLGIAAVLAFGLPQDSQTQAGPYEIRGLVLEARTKEPVIGAEISVLPDDETSSPVALSAKAVSGAAGAFVIAVEKAGKYRVNARMPGDTGSTGWSEGSTLVQLEDRYPDAEVELVILRTGALSGTVVDEDGRPAGNLSLRAIPGRLAVAVRAPGSTIQALGPEFEGKTDHEGHFAFSNLAPGGYVVELSPQDQGKFEALTTFTADETAKIDQDNENTYWPGGHGAEYATPVMVSAGAMADVGTLIARKRQYFRVLVRIAGAQCDPEDKIGVISERVVDSGSPGSVTDQRRGLISCGEEALLTGYTAGNYHLSLKHDDGSSGDAAFTVGAENVAIAVAIRKSVRVMGTVKTSEGAKALDLEGLEIALRRADGSYFGAAAALAEDGSFELDAVPPYPLSIIVQRLPKSHYVKEVRYNGVALSTSVLPLDQGPAECVLTIVLGDNPATIAGTVRGIEPGSGRSFVLAIKWPFEPGMRGSIEPISGDGPFRMSGLAPGTYRVIALTGYPNVSMPDISLSTASVLQILERVLADSDNVELEAGAVAHVSLTSADLRQLLR